MVKVLYTMVARLSVERLRHSPLCQDQERCRMEAQEHILELRAIVPSLLLMAGYLPIATAKGYLKMSRCRHNSLKFPRHLWLLAHLLPAD